MSIVNVSQTERGNSRNTDATKITNFDEFNDINFLLVSLNKYWLVILVGDGKSLVYVFRGVQTINFLSKLH